MKKLILLFLTLSFFACTAKLPKTTYTITIRAGNIPTSTSMYDITATVFVSPFKLKKRIYIDTPVKTQSIKEKSLKIKLPQNTKGWLRVVLNKTSNGVKTLTETYPWSTQKNFNKHFKLTSDLSFRVDATSGFENLTIVQE